MPNFFKGSYKKSDRTEIFHNVQDYVRRNHRQNSGLPTSSQVKFSVRGTAADSSDIKYSLRGGAEDVQSSDVRYSVRGIDDLSAHTPRVAVIDGKLTYLDGDPDMPTFSNKVKHLMRLQGLTGTDLRKRILMDRRLWSKLAVNSDYKPSKDTAVAVCIGLCLNIEQAKDLLGSAGYTLSDTIKQDVVMCYFFENGIYDIDTINDVLDRFGFKCIGAGK